jgi:hypothetical protein
MNYDKLSIINAELAQTGNTTVAVVDDDSEEWNVCSPAYDVAVDVTVERHDWNFGTQIVNLQRAGTSPDHQYTDAYAMPQGFLSIVWVRLANGQLDQSVDYKIIGNQICLSSNNMTAICKCVVDPGVQNWPPLFIAVIRLLVRAAIYRGLMEEAGQADKEEAKAEMVLGEARTRVDQNAPKRAMFNSRVKMARRVRRPWIGSPAGWSGTDTPN